MHRRGYEAHDTDQDENAVWVNRTTGEVTAVAGAADRSRPGWLDDQEWRVVPSKVQALAGRAEDRLVFLCGSTANEDEVWHLFSRVIYLAIDEQTLSESFGVENVERLREESNGAGGDLVVAPSR